MTSKFKVTLKDGKTTMIENVNCKNTKVIDLKQKIHDKEGFEVSKLILLSGGATLDDDKLLSDYGMGGALPILVSVAFKTLGGAAIDGESYEENSNGNKGNDFVPKPDFTHPQIQPSKEECCLGMGEEDETNVKILICGCVYSATALHGWALRQLKEETGFEKFQCPNSVNCKKKCPEWSFYVVACAIGWTESLCEELYSLYTKKQLDPLKYKQCPFCYCISSKELNDKLLRRRCANKSCIGKQDWCWHCLEPWRAGNNNDCGNEQCYLPRINKILQSCPEVEYKWSNNTINMKVPEYRACVNGKCRALIHVPQNCNEVTCDVCHFKFCFICLENWPCIPGRTNHPYAQRQNLK